MMLTAGQQIRQASSKTGGAVWRKGAVLAAINSYTRGHGNIQPYPSWQKMRLNFWDHDLENT